MIAESIGAWPCRFCGAAESGHRTTPETLKKMLRLSGAVVRDAEEEAAKLKQAADRCVAKSRGRQLDFIRAGIERANELGAKFGWSCFLYSNDGTVRWRGLMGYVVNDRWLLPDGTTCAQACPDQAAALADMIEELEKRQ